MGCLKDLEQAILQKDKDGVISCCSELYWCDRDVTHTAEGALCFLIERHFALAWQKVQTKRRRVVRQLVQFKEECRAIRRTQVQSVADGVDVHYFLRRVDVAMHMSAIVIARTDLWFVFEVEMDQQIPEYCSGVSPLGFFVRCSGSMFLNNPRLA